MLPIEIIGVLSPAYAEILTDEAQLFLVELERRFGTRRRELLAAREVRQVQIDAGQLPDFLPETREIRESDWTVAPIAADLQDRRVEITGPVERKMVINALNSGANVFMADFEDSHSPTWAGTLDGHINLRDAIRRTITFEHPTKNKTYKLNEQIATLLVRPRGWHLDEKHILIDGRPMSGALADFGLYFITNAQTLLANGSGPYFYLPKLESHLEARLWNDVFTFAQAHCDVPHGSIRATVLIETILAAFEMDEILYELRDHSAGLNCGRWDYIFSTIKKFSRHPSFTFPNRAQVTMTSHMMHSYSLLCIQTCHKRGIHAMGGMAAQIPIKNDAEANDRALEKVRQDKIREAKDGHDGTWVAHPGLVKIAKDVFDEFMPAANQIERTRADVSVNQSDLLRVPEGDITQEGMLINIDVGVQYVESWLRGSGCVPIYNLMEDAATAEISRSQLWQWIHNPQAQLADGRTIDAALYHEMLPIALQRTQTAVGAARFQNGKFQEAISLMEKLVLMDEFTEFLTLPAYAALA